MREEDFTRIESIYWFETKVCPAFFHNGRTVNSYRLMHNYCIICGKKLLVLHSVTKVTKEIVGAYN